MTDVTNICNATNIADVTNITTITSLACFFPYSDFSINLLVILNVFIIVLSIVGNGIVIYGSKMFNAIKMDKTSLLFLENLAFADILIAIVFYLPITLTLIARRWVLGHGLCFVNAFFTSTPSIAEIWVLTAISVHRIWAVKNPFIPEIKNKYIHAIIACLWLLAISPPFVWVMMGMFAFYDPFALSCVSSVYTDRSMELFAMAASILLVGLPLMVVVVCNIYLLYISISHNKRMGQSLSGIAVLTITVICWTFVISWFPFIVLKVILPMFANEIPPWFYIFQIEMLGLNVTLNPVIYTVTNRRFRNFLFRRVLHIKKRRETWESRSTSGNLNRDCRSGSRDVNVLHRMSTFSSASPPAC